MSAYSGEMDSRWNEEGRYGQDDAWIQAYNNAAERLFGKIDGDSLTNEQDDACVAAANAEVGVQ